MRAYRAKSLEEAIALASEFFLQALEMAEAEKDLEHVASELKEWQEEVSERLRTHR